MSRDRDITKQLVEAAKAGRKDRVGKLLVEGADVNASVSEGRTALIEAADHGLTAVVELLLTHKADVTFIDSQGHSTLMRAALCGHEGALDCLLSAISTDPNTLKQELLRKDNDGKNALMLACTRFSSHAVLQRLAGMYEPEWLKAVDYNRRNTLYLAVEHLLETWVDPEEDHMNEKAEAQWRKRLETTETELLKRGKFQGVLPSVVHAVTKSGETALTRAAQNQPIRDLLIQRGGYDVRTISNGDIRCVVFQHSKHEVPEAGTRVTDLSFMNTWGGGKG